MRTLVVVTTTLLFAAGVIGYVAAVPARAAEDAGAPRTMQVKNLKTLAVVYRGEPGTDKYMDDTVVTQIRNGFELGRLFYFRNSRARLNVEFEWLLVDIVAPDNAGPTYDNFVADLRERGVGPGQHDGMIVTGVGMAGNWGGFNVFDGTAACFGGGGQDGGLRSYPEDDPETGYGWAWIFAHEFQHAVDLVTCEQSNVKMLHAHPYVDSSEVFFKGYYRGGEHWDWIALTFREFDDWLLMKGVRNETLTVTDADGDGFPDNDPRLPMDEKRFGSDPTLGDTDRDGLNDLGEFTADRYAGSDPRKADTDGDGIPDNEDPYPVVAIRPTLAYQVTPRHADLPLLVDSVFVRNDEGGAVAVHGGWNEDALFLRFVGPRPFSVAMKLDGSAANGYWEGGDTYILKIADGAVTLDGLGLSGPVAGATAKASGGDDAPYTLDLTLPVQLGQGVSKEINFGGKREPQDVVDGLTLVPNRSIAFNFILDFADRTRAVVTPHHTVYGTLLVKPADLPDRPLLRAPAQTRDLDPVAEVLGVGSATTVEIVTQSGTVVGNRIGPGPVVLVGLVENGSYTLTARATTAGHPATTSAPATVVVDRAALPPTLTVAMDGDGTVLVAAGEAGGALELWWGYARPAGLLGGAPLGDAGEARIALDENLHDGWAVRAFEGQPFESYRFAESWPKIDRVFQMGSPDPRLPPDHFSYIFEGYLTVEDGGLYTFELSSDDGTRLYINDEAVINNWGQHGLSPVIGRVHLPPGTHRLRIPYYELDGWSGIRFRYASPGGELTFDVPVTRVPLDGPTEGVRFFARQTDALGNVSDFALLEHDVH